MFKLVTLAAATAMAVTISSAAERRAPVFSEATLAALDPTRAGRMGVPSRRGRRGARPPPRDGAALYRRYAERRGRTHAAARQHPAHPASSPASSMATRAAISTRACCSLMVSTMRARSARSARHMRLDPGCVMCWWGEALANGPNINAGMDDANNRAALAALDRAKAALGSVSPEERALIEAQLLRYSPMRRQRPRRARYRLCRRHARRRRALPGERRHRDPRRRSRDEHQPLELLDGGRGPDHRSHRHGDRAGRAGDRAQSCPPAGRASLYPPDGGGAAGKGRGGRRHIGGGDAA